MTYLPTYTYLQISSLNQHEHLPARKHPPTAQEALKDKHNNRKMTQKASRAIENATINQVQEILHLSTLNTSHLPRPSNGVGA